SPELARNRVAHDWSVVAVRARSRRLPWGTPAHHPLPSVARKWARVARVLAREVCDRALLVRRVLRLHLLAADPGYRLVRGDGRLAKADGDQRDLALVPGDVARPIHTR